MKIIKIVQQQTIITITAHILGSQEYGSGQEYLTYVIIRGKYPCSA